MTSKQTNMQASNMRDRRLEETTEVEENDEEKDLIQDNRRPKRKQRDDSYGRPSWKPFLHLPVRQPGGFRIVKKCRRDSETSVNATNKTIHRGTDNFVVASGRLSSRANMWLVSFVSSTIATASFAITSPNALRSGMQHIALLACSLGMFLSFVLACSFRHRLLREFLVRRFTMDGAPEIPFVTATLNYVCINTNQTLEMHLSIFSMFLWCVAAAVILDMDNSLAVAWTQVWSSNLYFSTWISVVLSSFLVAELITTSDSSGVHPLYYRGTNQVNKSFILLLFSCLGLLAFGASHLSSPLCDGALMETISCRNCIVSIAFAVIGILVVCFHFTLVVIEKTTLRPRRNSVDASLYGFCLAWFTLHAGIVTYPGAAGSNPNIFVSSWICFGLSMYLCIHHIDQCIYPNQLMEANAMKSGLLQYRTCRSKMDDEFSVGTTNQYSDDEEDDDAEDFPSVSTIRNGQQQDPLMVFLHAQQAKNDAKEEDHDDNSTLPTYRSHESPACHSQQKNKPVFQIPSISSTEKAVCSRVAMNYRDPPRTSTAKPRQPSILRHGVFGGNSSKRLPTQNNEQYDRKESNSSSVPSIDVRQQASDSGSESPRVPKSWLHQAVQDPVTRGKMHRVDRSAPRNTPVMNNNAQDRQQNFSRKDSSKSESRAVQSREAKRSRRGKAERQNLSIDLRVRSFSDPDQSRPLPPPPQQRSSPVIHKETVNHGSLQDARYPLPRRRSNGDRRNLSRDQRKVRKKSDSESRSHSPKERHDIRHVPKRDPCAFSEAAKEEPPAHRVPISRKHTDQNARILSSKKASVPTVDNVSGNAYRGQSSTNRAPSNTAKTERNVSVPKLRKISVHTVNSTSTSSTYREPCMPAAKNPFSSQPVPPPPRAKKDETRRSSCSPVLYSTDSPVSPTSSSTTTTNETPKTNSPEITRHILEVKKQELLNLIMSASESSSSGGNSTNSALTREGDVSSAEHVSLASSRKQQAASRKIWEALEIAGYTGSYRPPDFGGQSGTHSSSISDDLQSVASSKKSSITYKETKLPACNSSVPEDTQSSARRRSSVTFIDDSPPAKAATGFEDTSSTGSSINSLFTFKGGKPQARWSKSFHRDTKLTSDPALAQTPARSYSVHLGAAAAEPQLDFPRILKKNLSTRNASRHSVQSSGATSAYSKHLGSFFSIGTNVVDEEEDVVLEPGGLYAC